MGLAAKIGNRLHRAWLAKQSLAQLQDRLSRRRGVLGLCYHALNEDLDSYPYRTLAAAFDAQLGFLSEIFDILPAAEALTALEAGGVAKRDRPIAVLCFDDGYRCNLTEATPILERHALPATLFAARDLVRQPGQTYLCEAELRSLAQHDLWQVGGHGLTHNVLPGFLSQDQAHEIDQSHAWLTDLTGVPPSGFAYPQGQISATTLAHVQQRFDHAFVTDRRLTAGFDRHQIRRFCPMTQHDDVHVFAQALVGAVLEDGQA